MLTKQETYCCNGNCNEISAKRHWCKACNIVSYCSPSCKEEDAELHTLLCYPSLDQRLRALCRVRARYADFNRNPSCWSSYSDNEEEEEEEDRDITPSVYCNISESVRIRTADGSDDIFYTSAFRNQRNIFEDRDSFCPLCADIITDYTTIVYPNEKDVLVCRMYFTYIDRDWEYLICTECQEKDFYLCESKLQSSALCVRNNEECMMLLLFYKDVIFAGLCMDVIQHIILDIMYRSLSCCLRK